MKKIFSWMLICTLLMGLAVPGAVRAASFAEAGGWLESMYAVLSGVTDAQVTGVSYAGPISGSLTGEDLTYLVRDTEAGVRIDIPGLPAGTYALTVTTDTGELTQEGIIVTAHDRSGFAHYQYTAGVGAYNDDGTLKEGAKVLYVTEENKNTVSVTASDGTTVSGIGNILNSGGKDSGSGTNSKGGLANTNADILKKLAQDGTPLVVRIVGTVTAPEGLTAWGSIDYGGNEDDNGSMARMQSCRDITIEGIGSDAVVNGWGFSVICQTGNHAAGLGKSFEFRNLTFMNVPEDCIGLEGTQESKTLTDPIERCWVHNCAFYGPSNIKDASSDGDKAEGDGACDFKRGQYFTMSYCYYDTYHKTNLIGGSDSHLQYHVTWHHNYYKNCASRAPLARQADIHIYNNIFESQSSYCMSLRANTYIFSEYNLYLNCKKVTDGKNGGVCKSYNNTFSNCTFTNKGDLITVTDRSQTVTSNNLYANFDTNAELSYIPSGDYLLQEDMELVRQTVAAWTGPMNCSFQAPTVPTPEQPVDPEIPTDPSTPVTPGDTQIPAGSYVHNFTESGLQSDFYTISGNLSTSKGTVSFNGLTLTQCLKIESSTSIAFTAPEDGTLLLVFGMEKDPAAGNKIKLDGTNYIVGNDGTLTLEVSAGAHTVTKNKTMHLFYMAYIPSSLEHTHSFGEWVVVSAPTEFADGSQERLCSCGEKETQTISNNPFEDVGDGSRFRADILWAYYNGITAGKDATHFQPEAEVTRGQFVLFLWRLAGSPEATITESPFTDVQGNNKFLPAVLWAVETKITAGKTDTYFGLNEPCTRGHVVMFLYRYAGKPEVEITKPDFPDVNANNTYYDAIMWAVEMGITSGKADGTFSRDETCLRQQAVAFLHRYHST